MSTYRIIYYDADGLPDHQTGAPHGWTLGTREEARALILLRQPGASAMRWTDEDGRECYHEPDADGCGGWRIEVIE